MQKLTFSKQDKILILAPHPDDEAIACAGVLLKYPDLCTVMVLTDGSLGSDNISPDDLRLIRKKEFENAMKQINITKYKMMNIPDSLLYKNLNKLKQIDYSQYSYIFCPNPFEDHIDHKVVYNAIQSNIPKLNTKVVFYEVWTPIIDPTHYIDVSDIINKKKKLISIYQSQVKQVDYFLRISGLNCYRGLYPNVKYAEAFKIIN